MEAVGFADFRIFRRNGGTGDHNLGGRYVFGAVSFKDRRAQAGQSLRDGRTLQVRAGNFIAEVQQDLGNAAHADAADAHEMNALNFGEHEIKFLATDLHGSHG